MGKRLRGIIEHCILPRLKKGWGRLDEWDISVVVRLLEKELRNVPSNCESELIEARAEIDRLRVWAHYMMEEKDNEFVAQLKELDEARTEIKILKNKLKVEREYSDKRKE